MTDDSGAVPLPGATIVLQWTDVERRPIREPTEADGSFSFCVPNDTEEATLWAEFGDYSSVESVVEFDPPGITEVNLLVPLGGDAGARVVGRLYDADSGDPVAVAAVSILGRQGQVQSDRRGRFRLSGLPPGEHELRVEHLGYAPLSQSIRTGRGSTTEVEIGLVPTPLEMEPLVVTTTRIRRLEINGFYDRKYWGDLTGLGTFFTVADIDRRQPLRISHLIADAPGVRLRCQGSGINNCRLANARNGCPNMNAYIDGVRLRLSSGGGSIDEYVLPLEVGGIEVYQGAASLPAEFSGSDAQCGAVVIWTR